MTAFVAVAAAIFGAIIGSFLTVVAHRLPAGQSIVRPGSACPECHTPLRWRDNIPLVSWLRTRGRCAHCGSSISVRYPLLELGTALSFALVVAVNGADRDLVLELPFVAVLWVLAAIDLEHRILPNRIVVPAGLYAVAAIALIAPSSLPEHLIAGAAAFGAFLAIALAAPKGMGMGDVKLVGVLGLYLGEAVVPAVLFALLSGSAVGLVLMARAGVAERKRAVPFGPFLALGGLVGVLVGDALVDLYVDRFL